MKIYRLLFVYADKVILGKFKQSRTILEIDQ